jgi:hypothetical protein
MIPEIPFAASLFLVFILPLVLMVLFPAAAVLIGKLADTDILSSAGSVVGAGILGFLLAILINFIINKKVFKKYPPYISRG